MDFYKKNRDRIEIFWGKDKKTGILHNLAIFSKIKTYTLLSMWMGLMQV